MKSDTVIWRMTSVEQAMSELAVISVRYSVVRLSPDIICSVYKCLDTHVLVGI